MSESVTVPVKAKQAESAPSQWAWVDRAIWTERMLAALGNGAPTFPFLPQAMRDVLEGQPGGVQL